MSRLFLNAPKAAAIPLDVSASAPRARLAVPTIVYHDVYEITSLDAAMTNDPLPTPKQREMLCDMIHYAFVELRMLGFGVATVSKRQIWPTHSTTFPRRCIDGVASVGRSFVECWKGIN